MNRDEVRQFVGYCVDDSMAERKVSEMPDPASKVRYIGWACGFEPMFVAVWSYLNVRLDDDVSVELATDLLKEKGWFANGPTEPDYIL